MKHLKYQKVTVLLITEHCSYIQFAGWKSNQLIHYTRWPSVPPLWCFGSVKFPVFLWRVVSFSSGTISLILLESHQWKSEDCESIVIQCENCSAILHTGLLTPQYSASSQSTQAPLWKEEVEEDYNSETKEPPKKSKHLICSKCGFINITGRSLLSFVELIETKRGEEKKFVGIASNDSIILASDRTLIRDLPLCVNNL